MSQTANKPDQTPRDTKAHSIAAALKLFADKGFYGASMDRIAGEIGVTKQTLIHHFGTKEKLYGSVLQQISDSLMEQLPDADGALDGFARAISQLHTHTLAHSDATQLLMRELLDNRRRAAQAGTWYLRPFLDHLNALLRQHPAWAATPQAQSAAYVYQLLGAIKYFAVSQTTLAHMFPSDEVHTTRAAFTAQLMRLANAGPAPHNQE